MSIITIPEARKTAAAVTRWRMSISITPAAISSAPTPGAAARETDGRTETAFHTAPTKRNTASATADRLCTRHTAIPITEAASPATEAEGPLPTPFRSAAKRRARIMGGKPDAACRTDRSSARISFMTPMQYQRQRPLMKKRRFRMRYPSGK